MNAPQESAGGPALKHGFQLGDLKIDPATGEVSGPGARGQLDPKVMDVLVFLASHAGQVVLREDLIARLWPNTVVTDDALSRCIYELRRQLRLAGGDERFKAVLETLPKRGYRLNGEVTPLPPRTGDHARPGSGRRLLVVAAVLLLGAALWFAIGDRSTGPRTETPLPADISIAVLPFVDLSPGEDQRYLADGIAEEILNRLAPLPSLRVIARTSSFSFRGKSADIPEIAARLNVSHVLEGSVRRSGDRVRVTAQLIAASSNSHVWSETYDRKLDELFAVQDEIAGSVATALHIRLAGGSPHARMPESAQAYERFLQGKFFYDRRAPGDIERSVKYYREALAIDPGYATAWAALAGAYGLLHWEGGPSATNWRARQGEAARKAVELDPNLAEAHARLAQYYFDISDRERGREHRRRAAALDPEVLGFTGSIDRRSGNLEEAVARQRRLVARDPLAVSHRLNFGLLLLATGRLDEAMSEFQKVLELNPDAGLDVELAIVQTLVLQQRYDEAHAAIGRLPDDRARDYGLALLYRAPGRRAEADAALKRLAAQPANTMDSIHLANAYAVRGMHEEAFASLQGMKEVLAREADSPVSRVWHLQEEMLVSPFLTSLQGDPRWAALIGKDG